MPKKDDDRNSIQICPICEKFIRFLSTAVTHQETSLPAHFECILKELEQKEKPGPDEHLVYLGHGFFGVVVFSSNNQKFVIRKKIQYESNDKIAEWRRPYRIVI